MSAAATFPVIPPDSELGMMLARFRLRARLRAAWISTLQEVGCAASELLDRDAPGEMERWAEADPASREILDEIGRTEQTNGSGTVSRLASIFALSAPERDLFEACASVALDPGLRDVCAWLTGTRAVTERLAARIYGHGRSGSWTADSALFRWEIIRRSDAPAGEEEFTLDASVRDWLRGEDSLDESLAEFAEPRRPMPPLAGWPFRNTVEVARAHLAGDSPQPLRVLVGGPPGCGRRTFAAAVSAALGMPLVVIETPALDDAGWRKLWLHAQRHAFLHRCAIAWSGENGAKRPWPSAPARFPLQFVICESPDEAHRIHGVIEFAVQLPALSIQERARLWNEYAPAAWNREELDQVARRYRTPVGDIAAACALPAGSAAEAGMRVRESSRKRIGDLAQFLPCSFDWEDLVLPSRVMETLRDMVYEAQHRPEFWERPGPQRLFPLGRGLIALFSGASGTGKTMAAQVIAAALGYDLFRIDLAAVVSKYVGETSQNIDRVLRRAAEMDVVLFFDEADAMFARRAAEVRDAQDKFANTDAAHLLQAIESYPGIALLATNQKASMDQAFLRRIRYIIDFSKPEPAQRLVIWTRVVAELAGPEDSARLYEDLAALSRDLEITGAQIKNAVLAAVFYSRRAGADLAAGHLLVGLERELAKEGRTLSAKERGRISRP